MNKIVKIEPLLLAILAVAALFACAAGPNDGDGSSAGKPAGTGGAPNTPPSLAPAGGNSETGDAPQEVSWIPIPKGYFAMGCSPGDALCKADEKPRHFVAIPNFFMTATKITQAQYAAVAGAKPSYFTPANGYSACPNCPVETVNWFQAEAYCDSIGGRLPTEAEWEYAARADSTTAYSCGADPQCLAAVAWFAENAGRQVHAVGEKQPNHFDLYDMLGDAFEWTGDWYAPNAYTGLQLVDPTGPASGEYRVARGGGWLSTAAALRVSARYAVSPNEEYMSLGFRCVYR